MNDRFGTLVDEEATSIINQSKIICIYGMSLGETDKKWWKLIGQWIRRLEHYLIIYYYDNNISSAELTLQQRFDIEDQVRERFLELAEIKTEDQASIVEKLLVCINANLFNMNLVELTNKKSARNENAD